MMQKIVKGKNCECANILDNVEGAGGPVDLQAISGLNNARLAGLARAQLLGRALALRDQAAGQGGLVANAALTGVNLVPGHMKIG